MPKINIESEIEIDAIGAGAYTDDKAHEARKSAIRQTLDRLENVTNKYFGTSYNIDHGK